MAIPNFGEIRKLARMLTEEGIPYVYRTGDGITALRKLNPQEQLIYPCDGPMRKADAIVGYHATSLSAVAYTPVTYGAPLIEVMGLIDPIWGVDDTVCGYLTAGQVFEAWKRDWDAGTREEYTRFINREDDQ